MKYDVEHANAPVRDEVIQLGFRATDDSVEISVHAPYWRTRRVQHVKRVNIDSAAVELFSTRVIDWRVTRVTHATNVLRADCYARNQ